MRNNKVRGIFFHLLLNVKSHPLLKLFLLLTLLYLFLVSISMMSASFKFFGRDFAEQLLSTTANPFIGLFIGILATSIIQSSSTTTSITVALVAGGAINFHNAIPIIMGANVGTSITNTLVSIAHISRSQEFKRAFSAGVVDDVFNLLAIIILFPLQMAFDILGKGAQLLAGSFQSIGGLQFGSPLKLATKPVVEAMIKLSAESGIILLVLSLAMLFVSLRYIVILLKSLIIGKVEVFFNEILFKNAFTALILGLILTVLVQSSSVVLSLIVPLAGTGVLTIRQIFPYALGTNAGTTLTAMMAALVTGNVIAVATAFSHFLFNFLGTLIIWPVRNVPIFLAEKLAEFSVKNKFIPLFYILIVFFLIPSILIFILA